MNKKTKENKHKKVLIVGQQLNKSTGGGITLTNLFIDWPVEKLAIATKGLNINEMDFSKCKNVYLLGDQEIKYFFPLNLLKKKFKSGKIKPNSYNFHAVQKKVKKNNQLRLILVNIFKYLVEYLGLSNYLEKFSISKNFEVWLKEFSPDFIYTQAGSFSQINFINEIHQKFSIPVIIHIMDDKMGSLFKKGPFKNKIFKAFQKLNNNAYLRIAISEAMAKEYKLRYGNEWFSFHNSIDSKRWDRFSHLKNDTNGIFRILYIGRIGIANYKSINKFAKSVSKMNMEKIKIEFHLYVLGYNDKKNRKPKKLNNVYLHKPVSHDEIPKLIKQHDLLLLPLDFTKSAIKYSKFSMPTKMSEYMVSGVPILIFAPEVTAITKYAKEHNIAFFCSNNKENSIIKSLRYIISDNNDRAQISENAKRIAKENHDIYYEKSRFLKLLNQVYP